MLLFVLFILFYMDARMTTELKQLYKSNNTLCMYITAQVTDVGLSLTAREYGLRYDKTTHPCFVHAKKSTPRNTMALRSKMPQCLTAAIKQLRIEIVISPILHNTCSIACPNYFQLVRASGLPNVSLSHIYLV